MTPPTLRVVLADDHPVYRLGLRALIDSVEGLQVVGEAGTGAEAVDVAEELQPDVVVMDLRMPDLTGIEATRRITRSNPDMAVLVLTYADEDESVVDAMLAGARGFILKDANRDVILRAIQDVASGQMIVGASIAKRVAGLFAAQREPERRPFPELTAREYQVLELMACGLDNRSIAAELGVAEKRVRNLASDIYTKLQVTDRTGAIIRARDAGLAHRDRDLR